MGSIYVPSTPADVGVVSASESAAGIVELATAAEVLTGTDSGRAPSVAALAGMIRDRSVRNTGIIAETNPWWAVNNVSAGSSSSQTTIYFVSIWLPKCTVSSIAWCSGNQALVLGTSPHLVFALYTAAGSKVAQSTDDTAAVWAANSLLSKSLSAPVAVEAGVYLLARWVASGSGGTQPTISGVAAPASSAAVMASPVRAGYASGTPAATMPDAIGTLTIQAGCPYVLVS